MKTTRIEIDLPDSVMNELRVLVDKATDINRKTSFVLQIFDSGYAKGLYLDENDAPKVKEILTPLWDMAQK